MYDVQDTFMGHVSINGRIYELNLFYIGTEKERLEINGCVCSNFPKSYQNEWLKKKSIWVENAMVHFVHIHGKITVEVELLKDGKTPTSERELIPQYEGEISCIYENSEYLKNSEKDDFRRVTENLKNIASYVAIPFYWFTLAIFNEEQSTQFFFFVLFLFFVGELYDIWKESKLWLSRR